MNKQTKYLSIFNALIVLFIAGAAFTLSFDAIRELAESNGVRPGLSWLVPLTIDGAMLSFSLSVLRTSLANEKQYWGWFLIVAFVGMSVVFNIAHSNLTPLGMALAALAPLALLATFETLMSQIKSAMRGRINQLADKWRQRAIILRQGVRDWRQLANERKQVIDNLAVDYDKAIFDFNNELESHDITKTELAITKSELAKLRKQLGKEAVYLDTLPPRLADYVTNVSSGITPDGDYSEKWNIGVTTLTRANSMFLNGE